MRPLIGISCSMGQAIYSMTQDNIPQLQHRLGDSYVKAVTQAGGVPVLLPNNLDVSTVEEIAAGLDGFLLSGGGDMDPALFGERATAQLGTVTPRRDDFELALTRYLLEKTEKPVLGICRGIQVMNVAMGGTLHIDLPSAGKMCHSLNMYPRNVRTHDVQTTPGSRMDEIMGHTGRVNSLHLRQNGMPGIRFEYRVFFFFTGKWVGQSSEFQEQGNMRDAVFPSFFPYAFTVRINCSMRSALSCFICFVT